MRFSGAGMPASLSISIAFALAACLSRPWWRTIVSVICEEMRRKGFKEVMGSWKIMEILLPLIRLMSLAGILSRSSPMKRISPPAILPGGLGIMLMIERLVTDLPEPDSPTMPRVSPLRSSKLTPSTALTIPSSVLK